MTPRAERLAREAAPVATRATAPRWRGQRVLRLQRTFGNQAVGRLLAAEAEEPAPAAAVSAIQRARGSGQPLEHDVRTRMERGFDASFEAVRVHTGPEATAMSRALDARAFTVGSDIFFHDGEFNPGSAAGRELIAHELTHVVQQGGAAPSGPLMIASAADPAEREAEAVARDFVGHDTEAAAVERGPVTSAPAAARLRRQAAAATDERTRRVKVWLNTFIPMRSVGLVDPSYVQVTPDLPHGMTGYVRTPQVQWSGDSRGFSPDIHASSRSHQEIEFDTVTGAVTLQWKKIGTSHLLDPMSDAYIAEDTASDSGVVTTLSKTATGFDVRLQVEATNPLMPGAPAISADLVVRIDPGSRTATITGTHDGFPAYEVYVGSATGTHPLYAYDPRGTGETPNALFPPMDKTASGAVTW